MMQHETIRWCPHCVRATPHAPLPQVAGDEAMIGQLASAADPRGFFRRCYCLHCRAIWRSVELPVDFVEGLLASRPKLEELNREITLLRFLLANERAKSQPLKLPHAAEPQRKAA
jgi:hypothetical protein